MPITFTPHRKAMGAPFTPTSANNGLSVDPATGKIVLGSDTNTTDAQLFSNRDIELDNFHLSLKKASVNGETELSAAAITFRSPSGSAIHFHGGTVNPFIDLSYQDFLSQVRISKIGVDSFIFDFNSLSFRTPAPASGSAEWKLGRNIAGGVAFDPTQYVEVEINGAIVKLAVVI